MASNYFCRYFLRLCRFHITSVLNELNSLPIDTESFFWKFILRHHNVSTIPNDYSIAKTKTIVSFMTHLSFLRVCLVTWALNRTLFFMSISKKFVYLFFRVFGQFLNDFLKNSHKNNFFPVFSSYTRFKTVEHHLNSVSKEFHSHLNQPKSTIANDF